MITKFKLFEHISIPPKDDDYVLIDEKEFKHGNKIFLKFITSNIGQVVNVFASYGGTETLYNIKFDLEIIPDVILGRYFDYHGCKTFHLSDIKCWTENKEELEIMINSNKFNI